MGDMSIARHLATPGVRGLPVSLPAWCWEEGDVGHFESLLLRQPATGMAHMMPWNLTAETCWPILLAEGVRLMP